MTTPVLFAGGSGVVGRTAIKWFHERHPDTPVLVGGRDLQKASQVARDVEGAEAVAIDLDKCRMGLDTDIAVAAVVMLAPDDGLKGLNYAQDLGVPYLNIGNGLIEVGPEIAHFAHRPEAAPIGNTRLRNQKLNLLRNLKRYVKLNESNWSVLCLT